MLFAMVSTYFSLPTSVPDGSPRLSTFLLFISKLTVIFGLPSNNNTVERSTGPPPLPNGPCGPCGPVSPLGPCAVVLPLSSFRPLTPMLPLSPLGPRGLYLLCHLLDPEDQHLLSSLCSSFSFITLRTLRPSTTTTRWPLCTSISFIGLVSFNSLCTSISF